MPCSRDTETAPCHHLLLSPAGTTPHSHGRPALALQNLGPENIRMFKTRRIAPIQILKKLSYTCSSKLHLHNHPSHSSNQNQVSSVSHSSASNSHYPSDRQGKQTTTFFSQKLYFPSKNKVLFNYYQELPLKLVLCNSTIQIPFPSPPLSQLRNNKIITLNELNSSTEEELA